MTRLGVLLSSPCHCAAAFLAGACEAMLCPLERVQVLLQTKEFHHKFEVFHFFLQQLFNFVRIGK